MRGLVRSLSRVLGVTAGLIILACGQASRDTVVEVEPEYTTFQEAVWSGRLVPLATGDAYLLSSMGVYYVSRGKAQLVEGLPPERIRRITALADGSALAIPHIDEEPKLFLLYGVNSIEVVEGPVPLLSSMPSANRQGFFFAETQRLQSELDDALEEIAWLENPPEPEPTEDQ